MKNNNHLKELEEIKSITSKMRATVNESINFNEENDITDDDFGDMVNDGEGVNLPSEGDSEITNNNVPDDKTEGSTEEIGMKELDEAGTIDQIRELTLKGMMRLCKTPENPEYQALKKIFSMCDKSVDSDMKNQDMQKTKL